MTLGCSHLNSTAHHEVPGMFLCMLLSQRLRLALDRAKEVCICVAVILLTHIADEPLGYVHQAAPPAIKMIGEI
jgi:hypothetical protein